MQLSLLRIFLRQSHVFSELAGAFGTIAVAEANVGVFGDVTFHLMPIIAVIANLFAIAANWKQTLEQFLARERRFELFHAMRQRALQLDHSRTNVNSGLQFLRIERLRHVIVGPGLKSLDQIISAASRSQ